MRFQSPVATSNTQCLQWITESDPYVLLFPAQIALSRCPFQSSFQQTPKKLKENQHFVKVKPQDKTNVFSLPETKGKMN